MGYRRLNDSAALTALAALLTNLTEISSIFNATIATESPTVAPSAASTIDHSILDPHPEIIGIVYPPNIQDVKTDWHQLQSFKKRDFQDQNPPQTLDEFYARYDPWTGIGTGLMLGSFIFLIFLNIVIKWTLRQIRNQKQRKLNPELYEMARNWDGRPETLLNCDLSPDLLKVLETYQKVIFGPEVNFKLPTAGDSEKDLEKIEVAKPPQQPTDQSKAPRVQLNVNRVESVQQSPVLVVNKPQVELPVTRKLLSLACSQGDVEINLIAPTPAQTPSAAVRNFTTTMLPRTLPVTNLGSIPPYISDRLLMIEDDNASPIESHSDIFTTAAVHNYASKSIKPSLLQPDDHHRGLMRTQSVCVRLPFYPSSDSQLSQKSNCRQLVNGGNSFLHPNRLLESRSNRRFGSSSSAPAQCLETDL